MLNLEYTNITQRVYLLELANQEFQNTVRAH